MVLVTLGIAEAGGAPEESLGEKILWMDAEHQHALFLPERVTAKVGTEALPIKDYQRRVLDQSIARFKSSTSGSGCFWDDPPPGPGTAENPQSLPQLLANQKVAWIGVIKETVPGYTPWYHRVVTAVYLEVQEVLHGAQVAGAPEEGDVVAVFVHGGETSVAGSPLCGNRFERFTAPHVGQRFILAGQPWAADPGFFHDHVRFPVESNEVVPEPLAVLREGQLPMDLQTLKQEIRKERRSEETPR